MSYYIETPCGPIQGIASQKAENVGVYRGIRYATADRFCYPKQVTHWEGTYDASKFGNCSYQPRAFYDEEEVVEKAFYYNEFRKGEHYTYSDDCQFLNIWVPNGAVDVPVLFYIHGGGFTGGCGHEKHFEGEAWCKKGVIVVTINYRLGPIGFLCHPWLKEESGHTGNYGIYDQITALKWVHDNIAAFGGSPDKITIMGQSAGAMSVQHLVLSPLTEGLFQSAIMLSCGGVSKVMNPGSKTVEDNYPFWENVVKECGVSSVEELRNLDAEKLFATYQEVKKESKGAMMPCSPCNDGILLTETGMESLAAGHQKKMPYIICSTSEDVMPPILYKMGKNWCDTQHTQGNPDSYCAFFKRQLPGDDNGAWHSSDLWYAFGALKNCWRPFTDEDYALSDAMISYYSNFVKTKNPNGDGLPEWEPARKENKNVMVFDVPSPQMGKVSMPKLIKTMLTNKAVGE